MGHRGLHRVAHLQGHALEHDEHRAGVCQFLRSLDQLHGRGCSRSLHSQASLEEGALRLETDVTHHSNACLLQGPDQRRHMAATLEFDHVGPCNTEGRCILQRVFLHEVRAKGHVSHKHGLGARRVGRGGINSASDCRRRTEHVVHGHTDRVRQAQATVPNAVADKNEVHTSIPGEVRGREVIGSDHGELVATPEAAQHT
mmetsp:Transcript_44870/g.116239  ORF Transcript_44870/g.116239 Transcript_44870/m.116239 type:complete len:200 (+) Transcript_44870:1914-2513(+)